MSHTTLRFGIGQLVSTVAKAGPDPWSTDPWLPAVTLEPNRDHPGRVGQGAELPTDHLRDHTVVLVFHGQDGAQVLIEDIANSLAAKGLHLAPFLRQLASQLDHNRLPTSPPRCSDCFVYPDGRWRCDMNCGPVVQASR